ncbi:MAG: RNA polymerase sigma factor (sigma-70 family) [Verrucomicrobiales bacterium]|jgi:RNA polymerase sigma factor (sigma-70 family)
MGEHLKTQFPTTQWTQILGSDEGSSDQPAKALVRLCENYRYPVFAFIRKSCRNAEEAHDLTQGFFAFLIEKQIYRSADPERGRFRTFLLASVKNYLSNEHRKANRQKRGGGACHISIDIASAEAQYVSEFSDVTPDMLYDRKWANAVFDHVWQILESEYEQIHQLEKFEMLSSSLMAPEESLPNAELASKLGLSEAGFKSAVHRMRSRFRKLFRATVAQLVENPNAVDEEIRYLMQVMVFTDPTSSSESSPEDDLRGGVDG